MSNFVTREEAADMLGISTRTLDRYVQRKILRAHRRGRKALFLRPDVESIASPEPEKTHFVSEEKTLPVTSENDMTPFANLIREMHHEIQKKDGEIAKLSFELGKWQEISKNSVPLLEAKKRDNDFSLQIDHLQESLQSARNGRLIFFVLFTLSVGILGILSAYIVGF
ncbi:helix-turn-helix domain-containing protein [Candidatus Peregrinibacteria bacterium]|nr:MAG: helix-turn-helix domain-containing protein [Candidatus Peregrinibacteria bacterium]